MKAAVGIGIITFLLSLLWLSIQKWKSSSKEKNIKTTIASASLATCVSEVNWEEIEKEVVRLQIDKQRDISQMKEAFQELLHLKPNETQNKRFVLYLHLNEAREFIEVYSKEEGDFYTEYMIDQDEWERVLAYTISSEMLNNYSKPTIVCATLFSMTTAGYSSKEIIKKKRAPAG